MARLALADELRIETLPGRARPMGFQEGSLELVLRFDRRYPQPCRQALSENPEDNLALRAYRLLSGRFPKMASRRARLTLVKRVPSGAGLGGGSSNAAAALIGLAKFFALDIGRDELMRLAASLGSDVSFFIASSPEFSPRPGSLWWASGRGERLRAVPGRGVWPVLVIYPGFAMATAQAYQALDEAGHHATLTKSGILPRLLRQLNETWPFDAPETDAASGRGSNQIGFNSFEQVVAPEDSLLNKLKKDLMNFGARAAALSGSGSCLWALGVSSADTRRLARAVQEKYAGINLAYYLSVIC